MSIDFGTFLSIEEKRAILDARIKQFASEGWQHELNRARFEATGDEAGVVASDEAIAIISAAIAAHQAELDSLED